MADFMLSVLLLSRGFEESERKSGRLREKNEQARREQLREPFGSAPGWLVRESKSAPWTIDEAKAESVRKVFALAVTGHGSPEIAKRANAEKWPVPTRLGGNKEIWHVRMPGYLLRNRAVLGEHEYRIRTHEAHKASWHGQSTGITVPDYYPRIVSDEVWTLAQAAVDSRRTPMRRDDNYFNIFSGVMYCGSCGATMQRKIEFRGTSKGQIVCSNHQAGATECSPSSVKYVDTVLIREISRNAGVQMGVYEEMQEDFAAKLDGEKAKLSRLDAAAERIAETIIEVGDALPVLNRKARELAEERKQCLLEIDRLTRELADAKMDNLDKGFTEKVVPALYERSDAAKAIRADCNARFRRALDAIWIWPYDVAVVKYKHENTLHAISLPAKKGDRPGPFMMQALNNELQLPDFVNLKKDARFAAISMDRFKLLQKHNGFGHSDILDYVYHSFDHVTRELGIEVSEHDREIWRQGFVTLSEVHLTGNFGCLVQYVALVIKAIDENNEAGKQKPLKTSISLGFNGKRRSRNCVATIYYKFLELESAWRKRGPFKNLLLAALLNAIRCEIKLYDKGLKALDLDYGANWTGVDVAALFFSELDRFSIKHAIQPQLSAEQLATLTKAEQNVYLLWLHGTPVKDQFKSRSSAWKYAKSIKEKTGIDASGDRRPEAQPAINIADIFCPENLLPIPQELFGTEFFYPPGRPDLPPLRNERHSDDYDPDGDQIIVVDGQRIVI
jgi:hypothetical protein